MLSKKELMSNIDEPLTLEERTVIRKRLHSLKQQGMVPGVIHNHGSQSLHIMAPELQLERIYKEAGKHHPLQLHVGKNDYLALIKDVHINPVKRKMEHIVFQAIKRDEKVEAEVPIKLEGEIPAEKVGLMIIHQLDHIEVEALPHKLPDELRVDATKLAELHDKVTVADLEVPEGVTILSESEHPIATVVETKAMISDEAETEETELTPEEAEAAAEQAGGGEGQTGQAPAGAEAEAAGQQAPKS